MEIAKIRKGKPHLVSNVEKWGGKGDGILWLGQVFNVPPGFIISSETYNEFPEYQAGGGISGILEEEFSRLQKPVAVRSSAISEDGGKNSYAGQLETVLGVNTFQKFLDALGKVYASLSSDRVAKYVETKGIQVDGSLAVVVQSMIDAEVSGVAYSQSPNNPDEIVIESNFGLCSSVVDGRACDVYIASGDWYYDPLWESVGKSIGIGNPKMGKIKRDINRKTSMDSYDGKKITTSEVPPEKQMQPSLAEEQIGQVVKTVKAIEKAYGAPMDMEFAFERRTLKLYILQARPITGATIEEENIEIPYIEASRVIGRSRNIRTQGIFEGNAVVVRGIDHVKRRIIADCDIERANNQYPEGYILIAPEIPQQLEELVSNARAMIVTECGTTGHAAAIACERGVIYMGRTLGEKLLELPTGTRIGVAASKNEGIAYLL